MKLKLLIILICLVPLSSWSSVNMRNGSYTESWIDFIDPDEGFEIKIERFYSSRSLFIGLFGFGWCSSIETNLEITSDGIVNLVECGGGLEVTYFPDNFDIKSPSQTIATIIQSFQTQQKMTPNDVKNLQTQLEANTKMRFEYANKLHLVDTKKLLTTRNTFYAKSKGIEKIEFDGESYTRKKYDGTSEKFNKNGQLIQITNTTGQWLKINYTGSNLSYLVDNKGRRLNFTIDNNGKLAKISNGRGLEAHYVFQSENLTRVTNMWKKNYEYSYDSNHNLTKVLFPDQTFLKMTYDINNDWIRTYTNRKNCTETFDFVLSKNDPKNHYWGAFRRQCKGQKQTAGRHEFWYQLYSFSKDKYLHRVHETYESDFKDVYFHPFLGRPVSVRENEVYRGYAYYLNGLVNKQEYKKYSAQKEILEWSKSNYKYNLALFRMLESDKLMLDKAGATIGKSKILFEYDSKGLFTKARAQDGSFVSITYGENGRIQKFKNNKNIEIFLKYSLGIDKPSEINQPGLGRVEITYDTQGNIEDVAATPKRNVASSVIQNFLEIVEFLGPMGEILKI